MKKLLLIALTIFAISHEFYAQAPQAVCYQALAKDNQGNNITESPVSVRATIVNGSSTGIAEWIEVHNPQTDQFGLFTVEVGQGVPVPGGAQATFQEIDWGNGEYWLRIEFDPDGGGNFALMGATKIISVPYALYANGSNTASFADSTAVAGQAQVAVTALSTLGDDDGDPNNELQTLEFNNGELVLLDSDGNAVGDPVALGTSSGGTLDDDSTNELQTLDFQNGELSLLDANGNPSGSSILLPISQDDDATNELQNLALNNDELVLQNPDGSINPSGLTVDTSATNELQEISYSGGQLSISGGNSVEIYSQYMPFAAPGASFDLPQGILGEHLVVGSGNFNVPIGKTFWITAGGPTIKLQGIGVFPHAVHPTTPNMPVLGEGQSVEDCMCTGVLIDKSPEIEPIVINFEQQPSYTVPTGRILFIKSGLKNDEVGYLKVNDLPMEFIRSNFARGTRIISFPEQTLVEPIASNPDLIVTGFLISNDF